MVDRAARIGAYRLVEGERCVTVKATTVRVLAGTVSARGAALMSHVEGRYRLGTPRRRSG